MKQIIVLGILLFTALSTTKAQSITVSEEPTITRMMDIYANGNKARTAEQTIDGFRIQLAATTDRRKVDQMQSAFSGLYPGVYTGWTQAAPYYRVRVGGFVSRNDATKFLGSIKKDYPDAYIVTDKVKTTEITNL